MTESPHTLFLPGQHPGAVLAEGLNEGSDAHYGNPAAEQRRLLQGRAFSVLGHRAAVRVAGEDRLSWLNSLMSQELLSLAPGQSRRGLFLTAQGRVDFDVDIVATEKAVVLLTGREQAPALAAFLERMRFMLRVEVQDLSSTHGLLGFAAWEPLPEALRTALLRESDAVFSDPWAQSAPGGYAYWTQEAASHLQEQGYSWTEVLLSQEALQKAVSQSLSEGLTAAGALAVEAIRIFALKPRHGAETDDKTIPHELDLLRTSVHLAKGCYKGQETVARVHNLGHPPRRLVFLHVDGSGHSLPAPGAEVFLQGGEDGRPLGRVTSSALHTEAGPIALAVIKRSADTAALLSLVDGDDVYPAAQMPIVAADAGSVVGRNRDIRRLS